MESTATKDLLTPTVAVAEIWAELDRRLKQASAQQI
jgi:hypothetical protein